jgi:ABC-type metal ion transport system, periplasmic component/surface antigen
MTVHKGLAAAFAAVIALSSALAGCSSSSGSASAPGGASSASASSAASSQGPTVLKVAADPVPHAELLEFVKPKLKEEGVDLQITVLDSNSGSLANERTNNGEYDVNFFQHLPYLESVKQEKGYDLASAGKVHVEPIGAYSVKYKKTDDVPENATVVIPNDTTNEYRALKILEDNGFIKLKSTIKNYSATVQDVETYVKPIKITELDSAQIIRVRDQFDVYITNTNKILDAGIDATAALFREGADSPYANILVTKTSRVNDPAVVKLREALNTPEVKKFIEDQYKGAVVPAF